MPRSLSCVLAPLGIKVPPSLRKWNLRQTAVSSALRPWAKGIGRFAVFGFRKSFLSYAHVTDNLAFLRCLRPPTMAHQVGSAAELGIRSLALQGNTALAAKPLRFQSAIDSVAALCRAPFTGLAPPCPANGAEKVSVSEDEGQHY
jgi:hypothetical protein